MKTAKLLTLGLLGGSSAPAITYLFRDEFTTDAAAPLTSPRTAEPGPGTATIVDTGNTLSVASGILTSSAAPTGGSDPRYGFALARQAGLLFQIRAQHNGATPGTGNNSAIGLFTTEPNTTSPFSLLAAGVQLASIPANTSPLLYPGNLAHTTALIVDDYRQVSIVCTPNTSMVFLEDALCFVYADTTANFWAGIAARTTTTRNFLVDYAFAVVLAAPFTTDHGIATLNVASPTDATEYTGDAEAIIDLTVTAPGSLDGSATTRCGFYYRADSDLSPAWHCYVDGTGAFNVDSIASDGTRTNRITVAGVITGGGTRTLRVICAGTTHNAYTLNGTTWTKRGSEVSLSLNDAATTIEPSIPAGWSAANLRCYPRTSTLYEALDPN